MKTRTFITTIRLTVDERQPDNMRRMQVATRLEPQQPLCANAYQTDGLPNAEGIKVLIESAVMSLNSIVQYAHTHGIANECDILRYAIGRLEASFITPAEISTGTSSII